MQDMASYVQLLQAAQLEAWLLVANTCVSVRGVWGYELLVQHCCGCVMAGMILAGLTDAMSLLNVRQGV